MAHETPAGLSRRAFGLMMGAGALGACATTQGPSPRGLAGPARLSPFRMTADRVIGVKVGLRPYRPSGFVVRGEALGGKRLVHNYGHGGAGITLSWGISHLAVDMGFAGAGRPHAVIGCGAVGLATARLLQRRGGRVTIYAEHLPPHTTSNIAGGQWWPSWAFENDAVDAVFLAQFHKAARLSYGHFQTLVGSTYGVSWRRNYYLDDERKDFGPFSQSLADVAPEMAVLEPGSHPFGNRWVQRRTSMQIEPAVYLQALTEDFLTAGGRIEVRRFEAPQQLGALSENVIFNCTGLGARGLFGDTAMIPARGQLLVFLPQPELDYNVFYGASHMFPRSDGVLAGGTFDRDNWSLDPDPAVTARIIAGAAKTAATLTGPAPQRRAAAA